MSDQNENTDGIIGGDNLTDRIAGQDEAMAKLSTAADVEGELQRLFAAMRRDAPVQNSENLVLFTDGAPNIKPEQLEEIMAGLFPKRNRPHPLGLLLQGDPADCFALSRWPDPDHPSDLYPQSGSMRESCGGDSLSLLLLLAALHPEAGMHHTIPAPSYPEHFLSNLMGHPDGYMGYGEGGLLEAIKKPGGTDLVLLDGPDGDKSEK